MNDAAVSAVAAYVAFGIMGFFLAVFVMRWVFRVDRIVSLLETIAARLDSGRARSPAEGAQAPAVGKLPGEVEITESNLASVVEKLQKGR